MATSPNYIDDSFWLKQVKRSCAIIPNCIDENRLVISNNVIENARKIRDANRDKIICLAVGRHVEYKGFNYLIEASKYLDDHFEILITGKGPLTEKLKAQAINDPKIRFLGQVSDEDLLSYLQVCDIFCFPSITKNEAFGLALAEGMYFGKPAVTFSIPGSGVNYVNIDGVTGIEVENSNSKKYADAIMKLANNEMLRMQYGDNAKKRIIDNFTYKKFEEKVVELIRNI